MKINDVNFVDFLRDMTQRLIAKELKGLDFVKSYPATVVAVNGTTADVKMPCDDVNILEGLKIKTGEVLSVGDNVYLVSPDNNLTNSFIAWKF